MDNDTILKQAQYLFTTSRRIRSHVSKTHAQNAKRYPAGKKYHDLTLAQHAALMAINERGPSTIKALAEALGISAPSASAMVDKLVAKDILIREQSLQDRREVTVSFSPAAAKRIEALRQHGLQAYVDLIKKVGPQTARKWCEVTEAIKAVVEMDGDERPAKQAPATNSQEG